jgi:hypothetical protein
MIELLLFYQYIKIKSIKKHYQLNQLIPYFSYFTLVLPFQIVTVYFLIHQFILSFLNIEIPFI